jgi:hypothetical protein
MILEQTGELSAGMGHEFWGKLEYDPVIFVVGIHGAGDL